MRVALEPLKTRPRQPEANLAELRSQLRGLASFAPDLVVLPECTLTGYVFGEDDLQRFAEPLGGQTTEVMAELARALGAYLNFGFIERADNRFFDTGVLLDRSGQPVLVQRKLSEKPPFSAAERLNIAETELGKQAILICGDLFYEDALEQLPEDLDLLLVPLARSFAGTSPDPVRWQREERNEYREGVKAAGVTAFLVNALEVGGDSPSFGGAMVVSADGEVLAETPHGSSEPLLWEA